MNTKGVVAIDR